MGSSWKDYVPLGHTLFPDAPPDVTKTPQAAALQNYATTLATQNPGNSPAASLQEGAATPQQLAQQQQIYDQLGDQIDAIYAANPGNKSQAPDVKAKIVALENQRASAMARLNQMKTDTQGNIDPAAKAAQTQALQMELDAAAGKAPSAAEQLLRQQTDANMANQLALAATTQGSNPGLSQRAGLAGAANSNAQAAATQAALRANEIAAAREAAANTATNQRSQNINIGEANQAAAGNQVNQALAGLGGGVQLANQNVQNQTQANAANQTLAGGAIGGGATLIAASDKTLKKDIKGGDDAADTFLSQLKPKTFEYKDQSSTLYPAGKRLGIIAQDLAKGGGATATGPDGKRWIAADVISQVLAGLGRLNEKVEGKK